MLADILGLPQYSAVGLLEMLFHFTAQYAPEGDIGRYSDKRIATGMAWHGKPGKLLGALAAAGWIDSCAETATTSAQTGGTCAQPRWVVHGWSEHADRSVLARLHREGKSPLQSNHADGWKLCTFSRPTFPDLCPTVAPASARASALPEPAPVPVGLAADGMPRAATRARHLQPARHPSQPQAAAAASTVSTENSCYQSFEESYQAFDDWPETDARITEKFPATDPPLRRQIIEAGVQAHIGAATNGTVLTDKILAKMIAAATRDKQRSAKLYLTTLPVVVANEVRAHERRNHA
jgi:hypothetical protein